MAVRPIVSFPDPRLRAVCAEVRVFDHALATLAGDLLDTLRAASGIGITAAHAGVLERLVVIELSPQDGARIYVNPRIAWAAPEKIRHPEGSVSMPGVVEEVERAARVRVEYQDLAGAPQAEEAEGLLAVCLQHEIDQLDGVFWTQQLSRLKRERVLKRYEKLRRSR